MLEINEKINRFIGSGGTDQWCASAVVTERGVTYIRYDAVRVGNATDGSGGLSIQFVWQGAAVAWTRVHGAGIEGGKYLTTGQIDGRLVAPR